MATSINLADHKQTAGASNSSVDKAGLSELQQIQIMLGLWDGNPDTPVKTRALPAWDWKPNDRWRALEGVLSDHPEHDTSEMKQRNRDEEEEHYARKFGRLGGS